MNQTVTSFPAEDRRLAVLHAEVGLALTSGKNLHEMLRHCTESMVRQFDATSALIWTTSEEEGLLELQAASGLHPEPASDWSRVSFGRTKIGRLAEVRTPVLTSSLAGDRDFPGANWLEQKGLISFAGYPLLVQNRLVGVIAVFGKDPLEDFVLKALASVALQIALGIERKRGEETLQRTQERLAYLLANSPAIIYALKVLGEEVLPTSVSDNIEALFGYKPSEVLSVGWWDDVLHPGDRQVLTGWLAELTTHNHLSQDYRVKHRQGHYLWVRDEKRLIRDAAGRPVEIVGSWMDITERKQLEERFRQAQKMEAIGQLAGGVAHDFNNLLTVIRGNSELLLLDETNLPPQPKEFVKQVLNAAIRAADLTRQLLLFSRKEVLQQRPISLNDAVADISKMLSRIIGEHIHLRCNLASSLDLIMADSGMIDQVLMNLALNARDAMPQGGELSISTDMVSFPQGSTFDHSEARTGEFVRLCVRDSGTGITAEHMQHIFEPFFTTKEPGKGTGLGLALVYSIVKQHRGWVEVASEPGKGSIFEVYFPALAHKTSEQPSPTNPHPVPRGSETILMVEDEDSVRTLARRMLRSSGYKVIEAVSGTSAIELWKEHHSTIDLLLADFVLPDGISGSQLAVRFRAENPRLKVVFISGYSPEMLGSDFVSPEGAIFVPKPFSVSSLVGAIHRCLHAQACE